jgi:hypothetical protein
LLEKWRILKDAANVQRKRQLRRLVEITRKKMKTVRERLLIPQ